MFEKLGAIVALAFPVLVVAFVLYKGFKQKQKFEKQKKEHEEKNKSKINYEDFNDQMFI